MPVPNYEQYCNMLDNAKKNGFAYPAINITSTSTANAVIKALHETKTDGILQVSTGGAKFASGIANSMSVGALSLAKHIHLIAQKADVFVALHTDHCTLDNLDKFVLPLVAETEKRKKKGLPNLFNSHMFDGGTLPLSENLKKSKELLETFAKLGLILEIETGVVGGEEDGVSHSASAKLYTTPEDMVEVAKTLHPIGRFLYAATFGNVHGVYKPGGVTLKPKILKEGQDAVTKQLGKEFSNYLVFHGGSGSSLEEIQETLDYGVVKMNVDTDTQYAYTRPVISHMFTKYDQVLKVEGEVGNKKEYDPRTWMKLAEEGMCERVKNSIAALKASGTSIYK